MSFLVGCVLAVGLAFGFEYLDSRIRTPDEIKTHLGLPFLGLVPAIAEADRAREVAAPDGRCAGDVRRSDAGDSYGGRVLVG